MLPSVDHPDGQINGADSLFVVRDVLRFDGVFHLHVTKFLGVKDLATLQALDELNVVVPGNNSHLGMLADGCHCVGIE